MLGPAGAEEYMSDHVLHCDVLIVGGGLAGCNAAIAAAEKGAKVVVADKGKIERSGDIGGGVDHFLAFLNNGEAWDTRRIPEIRVEDWPRHRRPRNPRRGVL